MGGSRLRSRGESPVGGREAALRGSAGGREEGEW
jgi:hypothetical protein